MKIALLAGASSIHTIRWANGLSRAGHKVYLITQHPFLEPVDPAIEVIKYPFRGNIGYFLMVPSIRRLLKKIKPDVLNAHYASGYATTARLVGFHPWLLSIWGSDVYDFPYKSFLHRYLVKGNLMAADRVASTSYCMAEQARKIAPELKEIGITPFGVKTENFKRLSSELSSRGANEEIIVGTVKVLAPTYGIDNLINAFYLAYTELLNRNPKLASQLRLRIVGDGRQRSELEHLVQGLGISEITNFVGRVPHQNVPLELEKLDIYVALSLFESFGVAIIEAGAAGRPVVVSDAGGLPEVVVNNETGLVVPKADVKAASIAIMQLIEKPELRIQMGRRGQEHVSKHYDWKESVNIMINELEVLRDKVG